MEEEKTKSGIEALLEKANRGDATARLILGLMYADGLGVRQDYKEALRWLHLAAEQGDAKAQFALGFMYAQGEGIPQSYREAYKWYSTSATLGYKVATLETDYLAKKLNPQELKQAQDEASQWLEKFSQKK